MAYSSIPSSNLYEEKKNWGLKKKNRHATKVSYEAKKRHSKYNTCGFNNFILCQKLINIIRSCHV